MIDIEKVLKVCRLKYKYETIQDGCIVFYNDNINKRLIQEYINKIYKDTDIYLIKHKDFCIMHKQRYEYYYEKEEARYEGIQCKDNS